MDNQEESNEICFYQMNPQLNSMMTANNLSLRSLNLQSDSDLEGLYNLLLNSYVEDAASRFRFKYSKEFLRWCLCPPNYFKDLHIGIWDSSGTELVAFVSGVPETLRTGERVGSFIAVNFLCVAKRLRSLGVASVVIAELRARSNRIHGIFQGFSTGAARIGQPIAACKYFIRYLNVVKLERAGFVSFDRTLGPAFIRKQYSLPEFFTSEAIREMRASDLTKVHELMAKSSEKFEISQEFTIDELLHFFLFKSGVIFSYVYESGSTILYFFTLYLIGIKETNENTDNQITAAYCYYYSISDSLKLEEMFINMLIAARNVGADVFYALDIMDNIHVVNSLKFEAGDGTLYYYIQDAEYPELSSMKIYAILP